MANERRPEEVPQHEVVGAARAPGPGPRGSGSDSDSLGGVEGDAEGSGFGYSSAGCDSMLGFRDARSRPDGVRAAASVTGREQCQSLASPRRVRGPRHDVRGGVDESIRATTCERERRTACAGIYAARGDRRWRATQTRRPHAAVQRPDERCGRVPVALLR